MTFPTPATELAWITHYGYVVLFLLIMANELSSFFPMGILLIALGALSRTHVVSFLLSFLFATLASIVSDYLVFHISRRLGKRESYRRFVTKSQFATRIEAYMNHYPRMTVFISRLVGVASTPVNAVAGLSQMHAPTFVLFGLAGDAVCCFVYLAAGYFIGTAWQRDAALTSLGVGIALAIACVTYLISFYLHTRAKRKHSGM